jgi:hypothetical protein
MALERENRELHQGNEILDKAPDYFAAAIARFGVHRHSSKAMAGQPLAS